MSRWPYSPKPATVNFSQPIQVNFIQIARCTAPVRSIFDRIDAISR